MADAERTGAMRQQCADLESQLKSINDERELLNRIVKKLTDQIESLTEEMFGEANERVAAAERARFNAQVAHGEAEQDRLKTEEEMRQVRERMMKLKRTIEAKQAEIVAKALASKHESPNDYISRFSVRYESASDGAEAPLDTSVASEFEAFLQAKPEGRLETAYMERCLRDDILPCIGDRAVLALLASNNLVVEPAPLVTEGKCHISGQLGQLTYRMRAATGPSDLTTEWNYVTTPTYNCILAVGDLYTYIRYLNKGIIPTTPADVFREMAKQRLRIVCAKLGWRDRSAAKA